MASKDESTVSGIFAIDTESDVCLQRKMNGYQSLDLNHRLLPEYSPGAPLLIVGAVLQGNIWTRVDDPGAVHKS